MNKISTETLKQRSFILSSFTRMNMTLSTSIYEFADYTIAKGWLPKFNSSNKVDEEILNEYNQFMKNK